MNRLGFSALRPSLIRLWPLRARAGSEFVFIHINKTGGTSVERALHIPFEHKTALEKIDEMGRENWDKAFTFTVVRNPWDKVVSHYHYRVKTNQTKLQENIIEFKNWVTLTYEKMDEYYYDNPRMFMPQSDWISDENNNILVDKICRFENLETDFGIVCNRIGISAKLPHAKASDRRKYNDYYDDRTAEIVANWFRKDIENFGYEF